MANMTKQEAEQILQALINGAVKAGIFGDSASVIRAQHALEIMTGKAYNMDFGSCKSLGTTLSTPPQKLEVKD